MAKKTIYTERDIETLAQQGTTSITINDNLLLTDLAKEKAIKLGITLVYNEELLSNKKLLPNNSLLPNNTSQSTPVINNKKSATPTTDTSVKSASLLKSATLPDVPPLVPPRSSAKRSSASTKYSSLPDIPPLRDPRNQAKPLSPSTQSDLVAKVKATVIAKMGNNAPEELLDAIIPKILAQLNG